MLLVLVALFAVGLAWVNHQIDWMRQREAFRLSSAAYQWRGSAAPASLRILGEPGMASIMIENGTEEQIDEARRLFPEAAVARNHTELQRIFRRK
jgi:hypothetical protein